MLVKVEKWQIIELFEEAINDAYPDYMEFAKNVEDGCPASQILKNCLPQLYEEMFDNYCAAQGIMVSEFVLDGHIEKEYFEKVED